MTLPSKPPCIGQMGRITCPCAAKRGAAPIDCVERRMFWLAAQSIADMPSNADRSNYLYLIAASRGNEAAQRLRQAAHQLITERGALAESS